MLQVKAWEPPLPGCPLGMPWAEGMCSPLWSPPCPGLPSPAQCFLSQHRQLFLSGASPLPTQPLPLQVPIPLPVSCLIYPSD